jgi:hypothetical protein
MPFDNYRQQGIPAGDFDFVQAARRAGKNLEHDVGFGPFLPSPRCSDMSAVGGRSRRCADTAYL